MLRYKTIRGRDGDSTAESNSNSSTSRKLYVIYLVLSSMAGVLELGALLQVIQQQMAIFFLPLIAISYQISSLLRNPVRLPASHYLIFSVSAILCWPLIVGLKFLLPLQVFMSGVGLQGIRDLISERYKIGSLEKRLSRIVGFLISGFMGYGLFLLVPLVTTCLSILIVKLGPSTIAISKDTKLDEVGATMILHQSHYFSHSCIIPYLFVGDSKFALMTGGFFFAIGWVSYAIAPILFHRRNPWAVFPCGHFLVSGSLVLLYVSSGNPVLSAGAWFLTGFGGGSVYCLRTIQDRSRRQGRIQSDLDLWETVGHVTGSCACLAIILYASSPFSTFLLGASLAITTAVYFLIFAERQRAL